MTEDRLVAWLRFLSWLLIVLVVCCFGLEASATPPGVLTYGGTATASAYESGDTPAEAFDGTWNSDPNRWYRYVAGVSTEWLGYAYADVVHLSGFEIQSYVSGSSLHPTAWRIDRSMDGTSFYPSGESGSFSWGSNAEVKSVTLSNAVEGLAFRWVFTASSASGYIVHELAPYLDPSAGGGTNVWSSYWTSNAVLLVTNTLTMISTNTENILEALLYATEENDYYAAELLYGIYVSTVAAQGLLITIADDTEAMRLLQDEYLPEIHAALIQTRDAIAGLESAEVNVSVSLSNFASSISTSIDLVAGVSSQILNEAETIAGAVRTVGAAPGYDGSPAMQIANALEHDGSPAPIIMDQAQGTKNSGGWAVKQGPRDPLAENWYVHVRAFDPEVVIKAEVTGVGGGAMHVQVSNLEVNVGGVVGITNDLLWVGQHSTSTPWLVSNVDSRLSVTNEVWVRQSSNSMPWIVTNVDPRVAVTNPVYVRQDPESRPWFVSVTGEVAVAGMSDLIAGVTSNPWLGGGESYSNIDVGFEYDTNTWMDSWSNVTISVTSLTHEGKALTNMFTAGLQDTNVSFMQGVFDFSPPTVGSNPVLTSEFPMYPGAMSIDVSEGQLGVGLAKIRAMLRWGVRACAAGIMIYMMATATSRVAA